MPSGEHLMRNAGDWQRLIYQLFKKENGYIEISVNSDINALILSAKQIRCPNFISLGAVTKPNNIVSQVVINKRGRISWIFAKM